LYKDLLKDRVLSRCTALHAEESAIINAGSKNLEGCILYVTTFPCFNCAQKILATGIETICYVESYPDEDSIKLLEEASKAGRSINIMKFEGVKARAYFKFFDAWRRKQEELMINRRKK